MDHEGEVALPVVRLLILAVESNKIYCWREALVLSLLEILTDRLDRGREAVTFRLEAYEESLARARVNFDCLYHFGVENETDLICEEIELQHQLLT